MTATLKLLRPKQWTKNLLVFAAILFTNGFHEPNALARSCLAFVGMCLFSSAFYVFNDLRDIEKDRNHPVKKNRPLASGKVKPTVAIVIGAILLIAAAALFLTLGRKVSYVVGAYAVLQLIYNAGAKGVPVLDVFLISAGFVLRAVLGAAAINVRISAWLLLCTGALALLLGFAKRRNEFILQGENRTASRASLGGYNRLSLDALAIMTATASALCYGIYALESPTAHKYPALFITTPFVFYGICRYVLLIFVQDEGGEPENLLFRDKHLVASVILFIVSALFAVSSAGFPLVEFGSGAIK
jgi:4-hydroxybenzoate polyprenyltransferase